MCVLLSAAALPAILTFQDGKSSKAASAGKGDMS